ncbi:LysM peptidoglycan-binding domain-containing protein [Weissella paramesenteroides]|jgi:LysM repeat protein|uniref:LysM domain protein n=2 Tax=Weissella paramesenteroides TaxID=1249 RepID=C5RAK2_WEIPA|nr:LysM domain-containing protein [Weissella paramesenteroides]ATF40821.1 peptidoglycan-binding protein [Weissella paramesenteroides]EER74845.1 LysM domain protein [Weissella paramesenteroides ATCC 33313]KAA8439029.1 LysM peptidoglycan-binding domain-containing protein [Weissella paramesenteroides]KAA8440263.1 LysM peptidoglycan-binding domain-containing protein [Weissella paramesenteroides]KAA8443826.1 LysM peptidoglycan-binding domain-containing protein [Weissella paramesenteroides]
MNKKVLTALTVAGIATAAMATDVSADTYTVKSGDTLSSIAANHNTTVDRILNVNKIADANLIFVGEQFELDDQVAASTPAVTPASSAVATQQSAATSVASVAPAASQATSQAAPASSAATTQTTSTSSASGSTYDQFIAAGGTSALWTSVVMPESGGNVNASNGQYHGLGQTNQSWGYGSVASQTQGMLNYATSRYGSVENAISFRAANGWW